MYPLIILPPAARFLKKLKEKPLKAAFQQAIDVIRADPYRGELKTGDLSGVFMIFTTIKPTTIWPIQLLKKARPQWW
jgi:hypothetical protein